MTGGDLLHLQYSRSNRSLDRLYRLPRDTVSLEDFERRRHFDLPEMSDLELDAEGFRVRHRLAYDPDKYRRAWLTERLDTIRGERAARQRERRAPEPTAISWRGNFAADAPPRVCDAAKYSAAEGLTVPSGAPIAAVRGGGRHRGR